MISMLGGGNFQKKKGKKAKRHGFLMAVAAYIVTLGFKPTALVFATGLGAAGLCPSSSEKLRIGNKAGFLLCDLSADGNGAGSYRSGRIVGIPNLPLFLPVCESPLWGEIPGFHLQM